MAQRNRGRSVRPAAYWIGTDADGQISLTADECPESAAENIDTGLLDRHGNPIRRRPVRVPLGYRLR